MKRFINGDAFAATGQGILGHNMFAYCQNNPIVYADDNGYWVNIVIGAVVGAAVNGIATYLNGGDKSEILLSIACGAISGGLAATGLGGLAGQVAIGAITSAVDSGYQNYKKYADGEITLGQAITGTLIDATMGAAFGAMGYDGTDALKLSNEITESALDAARKRLPDVVHPVIERAAKKASQRFWRYVVKEAKKV